ncbi:MAG: hypothetical protein ACK2TT_12215, partial [Anaerolineales bacterium]
MKRIAPVILVLILSLVLAACGGKEGNDLSPDIAQGVAATQTKMAWEASLEEARQTEEAGAADVQEAETSSQPEIIHEMLPEESH